MKNSNLEYLAFPNIEKVLEIAFRMDNYKHKKDEYHEHLYSPVWGSRFNNDNCIGYTDRAHEFIRNQFISNQKSVEKILFNECKSIYEKHSIEIKKFMDFKFTDKSMQSYKDVIQRWNIFYDVDLEEYFE